MPNKSLQADKDKLTCPLLGKGHASLSLRLS